MTFILNLIKVFHIFDTMSVMYKLYNKPFPQTLYVGYKIIQLVMEIFYSRICSHIISVTI